MANHKRKNGTHRAIKTKSDNAWTTPKWLFLKKIGNALLQNKRYFSIS